MKTYKRFMSCSIVLFSLFCCRQADAQLASEKPVASFYSKLAKEKIAEKQRSKPGTPAVNRQLPSKKPLTKQTMEAVEKRRQQARM